MYILNQFSNVAFFIGAIYIGYLWKRYHSCDYYSLTLIILVALIGLGSFIFHTFPSDATIWIDLVPIQLFGLSYFAYIGTKYFRASKVKVFLALIAFFVVRQYWIVYMPRGAIGGGITHIPTLFLLLLCSFLLLFKYKKFSVMLLSACIVYVLALVTRAFDKELSLALPVGVHWIWHILTALTASILIYATVRYPAGSNEKTP